MVNLILGFVMDVIIFWGTAMGTAMSATVPITGKMEMPPAGLILFALTVAVVQAGRRWDSKTSASPIKPEVAVVRTPEQLAAQVKVTEDTIEHVIERVTQAIKPPAVVTPKRVEVVVPPEPVAPVGAPMTKDSS